MSHDTLNLSANSVGSTILLGAAYPSSDPAPLRVGASGAVLSASTGRYSIESQFIPYHYGQSRPELRPAV